MKSTQTNRGVDGSNESESVRSWFNGGDYLRYNPKSHAIDSSPNSLNVFFRMEGNIERTVTFLPGYPDGSYDWSKILPYLPNADKMPKLFIEYIGMGDSDKPKDYKFSTAERADLVEAIWKKLSVQSTVVVAFDFSSLVLLEHLQRRLERAQKGESTKGPEIEGVVILNGGLFTDGHSHPWYTTPVLRRLPDKAAMRVGGSFKFFKLIMKMAMWSREYHVSDAEVRELYDVMNRQDGLFYLAKAADFVEDHKQQGARLDFGRIFKIYHHRFPFLIGGGTKDPFEHKQISLTEKRLDGRPNLLVKRLPGGHLLTSEQPKALASLITNFVKESTDWVL
jgi:pimeloyl-ACP methyl ester carboxylesterase